MRSSAWCVQLDALGRAGEDHAVIADDRAAAQRRKADIAGSARAGHAVAAAHRMLRRDRCRGRRLRRWPSISAVPDGASIFLLWCISTISMSKFSSSVLATRLTSAASRLTPRLILPDFTMMARSGRLCDHRVFLGRQAGGADDVHEAALGGDRDIGEVAAGTVKSRMPSASFDSGARDRRRV